MKYTVSHLGLKQNKPVVIQIKQGPSALKIAIWIFLVMTFGPAFLYVIFLIIMAILLNN